MKNLNLILLLLLMNIITLSANWEQIDVFNMEVPIVLFADENNLYLGTTKGIFISYDFGKSSENFWTKPSELSKLFITSIVKRNNLLYVGTKGSWGVIMGGFFVSTDSGLTWQDKRENINYYDIQTLAVKDNYIFASTGGSGGIYRSSDNGDTWLQINEGLQHRDIRDFTVKDNYIFASTGGSGGIYRSSDNGDTWSQVNNGIDFEYFGPIYINSLAVKENYIFAGTKWSHILTSTDNGNYWRSSIDLGQSNAVDKILIKNDYIFAQVYTGGGVFLSTNNGDTWKKFNEGLSDMYISDIAINYEYIFVINLLGELYRAKLSDITSVSASPKQTLSISPLPSSDFITISGIEPGVNVEIYSLLGIKLFETIYTGKIDISRLSMGVYYVKVAEQVEKFVVGERRSSLGGR